MALIPVSDCIGCTNGCVGDGSCGRYHIEGICDVCGAEVDEMYIDDNSTEETQFCLKCAEKEMDRLYRDMSFEEKADIMLFLKHSVESAAKKWRLNL